jgi:hypothetical protein
MIARDVSRQVSFNRLLDGNARPERYDDVESATNRISTSDAAG